MVKTLSQNLVATFRQLFHKRTPGWVSWYRHTTPVKHDSRAGACKTHFPTKAWRVVAQESTPTDEDIAFWWQATGPLTASLLHEANYDLRSQQSHLRFYLKHLVRRLGPRPSADDRPSSWRSFVTDDFSPLEYSWSWNKVSQDPPKIRFTIELIGPGAGSRDDPFNQTANMDAAYEIAATYPYIDLTWLQHFSAAFVDPKLSPSTFSDTSHSTASPSSIFLAFDLAHNGQVAMKAYLIPVKAEQIGVTRLEVVSEAIEALPYAFPSFVTLQRFLSTHPLGRDISIVGLGVDCLDPSRARLRLYIRSPNTSFGKVRDLLTLDGSLPMLGSKDALSRLQKLWYTLLSLPQGFSPDSELEMVGHETGGVLFSFDVKPGNNHPEAKVYVPLKHYSESDGKAWSGLKTYLEQEGKGQWIEGFERGLRSVGLNPGPEEGNRNGDEQGDWKEGRGMQTYVGVGFEGENLGLTSYLAPGIYGGLK